MASLKEDMTKYFGTDNLYRLLTVDDEASEEEINRAYQKFSLIFCPDRASPENKDNTVAKFQILAKVHAVLVNKRKRDIYDDTGIVNNDLVSEEGSDWMQYFETVFKKVDSADIQAFEREYFGSEEEKSDLKKYYLRFKGDESKIVDFLKTTSKDESRYKDMISDLVKSEDRHKIKTFEKGDTASSSSSDSEADGSTSESDCEDVVEAAVMSVGRMIINFVGDVRDEIRRQEATDSDDVSVTDSELSSSDSDTSSETDSETDSQSGTSSDEGAVVSK